MLKSPPKIIGYCDDSNGYNELIKQYDSETRKVLGNMIIYEEQYYSLRKLLEEIILN